MEALNFSQARKLNERTFLAKKIARRLWAKRNMRTKIKELLKLQEIFVAIHHEYSGILPWKI